MIAVDPQDLGASASRWSDLASDAGDLHNVLELAVAAAATCVGEALLVEELGRFWSRWGSSVGARMADLGLVGELVGESAGAYGAMESAVVRHVR